MKKINKDIEIDATELPDLSLIKEYPYKLIVNYTIEISNYEFDHEFGTESNTEYSIGDITILNDDAPPLTEADMSKIFRLCEIEMEKGIPYD